jgi:hypothetical protein
MNDIWRSERLVYRAFEAPTDDKFWHSSLVESEVFVNGIEFLPRPWSAEELIEETSDRERFNFCYNLQNPRIEQCIC